MRCMECENAATIRVKDRRDVGMRVMLLCDIHASRAVNANLEPRTVWIAKRDFELEVIE